MKITAVILSLIFLQNNTVFQKLVGTWQMKTSQGTLYETWQTNANGSFSGITYMLNGKDSVILERSSITIKNGDIYYSSALTNQNGAQIVPFKLVNSINNYHIFENKEHDFPQRIIYEFVTADSVHARIEGKENGKAKAEDFYYSRMKQVNN